MKADRLAFSAAELLHAGQVAEATAELDRGIAIVGMERMAFWLRHYAVTKFRVDPRYLDKVCEAFAG